MKKCWIFTVMLLSVVYFTSLAQRPTLTMTPQKELQIFGQTNRYYRIESSSNLMDWTWKGSYFLLSSNPHIQNVDVTEDKQEFFRARVLESNWLTMNNSIPDICAEHDNVSVVFRGNVTNFSVIATHPTNYVVTDYICAANFNNCNSGNDTNFVFTPFSVKTDFGVHPIGSCYVVATRKELWWKPQGMTHYVDGVLIVTNVHLVEIGRYIVGTGNPQEWPIYFVFYSDGYMRLIPFPPEGHRDVCVGSSVIIGPAKISERPFVDVASVNVLTYQGILEVTYRDGGTARIEFKDVTRERAIVNVSVNYPTDQSFCTFRSMYVADGNSDCDRVVWSNTNGFLTTNSIMSFSGTTGTNWFFNRQFPSIQRKSAPDIRIILQ